MIQISHLFQPFFSPYGMWMLHHFLFFLINIWFIEFSIKVELNKCGPRDKSRALC